MAATFHFVFLLLLVPSTSWECAWFCRRHPPASIRPQLISLKKGWFLSSSQLLSLNPRRFAGSFISRPSQKSLQSLLKAGVYEAGSFKILRATSSFSTWRERKSCRYDLATKNWRWTRAEKSPDASMHVQYLLSSYSKGPFGGNHLKQGDSQRKIIHRVIVLLLLEQLWSHETYIHRQHFP